MTFTDTYPGSRSTGEANHRIANHLALLSCYVRLKGKHLIRRAPQAGADDIAFFLKSVDVQIAAVSELHRLLSSDAGGSLNDLGQRMKRVCQLLASGVSGEVVIAGSFDSDCTLAPHRILPTLQLVTEVITNALKHGFRPGTPGRIEVSCSRDADRGVVVEVRDNGPGLPAGRPDGAQRGFGADLVQTLTGQIDGTIEYPSTDAGLTVCLWIPSHEGRRRQVTARPVLASGLGIRDPR